ncbi:uncharacterized protein LOC134362561 [Cynocephalus volans]|uniref:uncharacterized protein LOC134362561 n=1 Tax=Cynocephalus volans TaxID=110931 RepID=UPI002FC7CFA7
MRSSGRLGAPCLLRRRLRSGNLFCHRVRPAGLFDPLGIGWAASWVAGVWDATFLDAPRLRRRARLETTSLKGGKTISQLDSGCLGLGSLLSKFLCKRWKDYLPVGQRMPGTRFIAFQVPLQKSFEEKLAPEEHFSPLNRFNKTRESNEELGLIIDLTYTQRYYKPELIWIWTSGKLATMLDHKNKGPNVDLGGFVNCMEISP